jgi:hypothetical protein
MAEPEWDQATRDLVLALDAVPTCPVCGRPSYLCQDPARQEDWKAGDPIRCHATTARLTRQKGVTEQTNPHMAALVWPVSLLDRRPDG